MSEPSVANPLPTAAQAELRDESLEALPQGAALLDLELNLLRANAGFLAAVIGPRPGAPLSLLLPPSGEAPFLPRPGESTAYLAHDRNGQPLVVHLGRRGEQIGAMIQPAQAKSDPALSAALSALGEQGRAQDALLRLSREVALAAGEDELMASIARCVRQLFPGRVFAVRVVDPRTSALTSLYAEGRMRDDARDHLALRQGAAEKAGLEVRGLPEHVVLTDEEPLVFAGTTRGFATPLSAAGQFFGLVNLEYPPGLSADLGRDEKLLIQLANQAAIGVRNAKLIDELTFVRKYLEELLENANALILVLDRELRVVVYNRALAQLTGFTRGEVLGRSILELAPESDRARVEKALKKSLAGEPVVNFDFPLLTRSGGEARGAFSTALVRKPTDEVEGVIAIGQDLSRQKELERRVVQAEKLASLGQLAAGVVHEINNPLTSITMYADALFQTLRGRSEQSAEVDKLNRIRESADRIMRFARDLTSYAKPAQERPELVDVHKVLDQAVRYCEHAIKESGATLVRSYGNDLPDLKAVKANLVQVFVNLITNAAHAMTKPGGEIELSTSAVQGGVEVEISDTGVGIDERNLARIFEPFFTTKGEGKGTGLGLTIVQNLIDKHGGSVKVRSTLGRGTTFAIWLPAVVEPE